jgi:hypothetical protein
LLQVVYQGIIKFIRMDAPTDDLIHIRKLRKRGVAGKRARTRANNEDDRYSGTAEIDYMDT